MSNLTNSDINFINNRYKSFLYNLKAFLGNTSDIDLIKTVISNLYNGKFSINGTMRFDNYYNYIPLPPELSNGVHITTGISCCRHANGFLFDILSSTCLKPIIVYIFIDEKNIWHRVGPSKQYANHYALSLNINNCDYIVDATNKLILELKSNGDLIQLPIPQTNILEEYHDTNIEDIAKTLKKYYTYRNFGVKTIYDITTNFFSILH